MRIMQSLPRYPRPFFLTLRAPNNHPEIQKRQYENQGSVRASRCSGSIRRATRKQKLAPSFSAKRNTMFRQMKYNVPPNEIRRAI
jgi:hypothetical protein